MDRSSRMNRDTANDLSHVMHSLGRRKIATATVERSPTDGSGRFSAVVSTFGPPADLQGDVVAPGAFLKSIADWRSRDMRPTLWWQHDYSNPNAAIGIIERMYEAEEGLIIEAQLDLDHEPALAVYEGLLARRLKEFSIGFAIISEHKEADYNVLDEVAILEASVVYAGANRFTRVLDIKTATTTVHVRRRREGHLHRPERPRLLEPSHRRVGEVRPPLAGLRGRGRVRLGDSRADGSREARRGTARERSACQYDGHGGGCTHPGRREDAAG
jgi:hypothetical protein